MKRCALLTISLAVLTPPASAGGLIGDIVRVVPGVGQPLGDALDGAHRQLKEAVPPYKAAEEAGSGAVRQVTREAVVESTAPVLAQLIFTTRDDTLRAGTNPVPEPVFRELNGFFPEGFLRKVRYRVGQGNDLLLSANAFKYGDAVAITLGHVIVFKSFHDSQYNLQLWAHELGHVQQYDRWGIHDFAKRYARDHSAVEREAEDTANRYDAWRARRGPLMTAQPAAPQVPGQFTPVGPVAAAIRCGTYSGICMMPYALPSGSQCWCPSAFGAIPGRVF